MKALGGLAHSLIARRVAALALGALALGLLARCLTESHGTVEKKGTRRFAGLRVVVLADKGDAPGVTPGDLYVSAVGSALPLRVVQTGPRTPGKPDAGCGEDSSGTRESDVRLSAFNEPVRITAPSDALDLSQLSGASGAPS